ncbi:hypothetical protein, partial [Sinorhizobium saheli]|uniref:hypothetical protein n=1 Tax=Sinorhizobium saheli TaxID=36856 RepID=UPI001AEE7ADA
MPMLIKRSLMMLSSVLTLSRSKDRCAADGAPDARRLGSAGCWKHPDKTQRRVQNKRGASLASFSQ